MICTRLPVNPLTVDHSIENLSLGFSVMGLNASVGRSSMATPVNDLDASDQDNTRLPQPGS
ncbi:MAG: hypothetical protein RQ899_09805 [Pseudomonadales bacterium]|nr:hypothetical protein [Pseudomonadales bacterium]